MVKVQKRDRAKRGFEHKVLVKACVIKGIKAPSSAFTASDVGTGRAVDQILQNPRCERGNPSNAERSGSLCAALCGDSR